MVRECIQGLRDEKKDHVTYLTVTRTHFGWKVKKGTQGRKECGGVPITRNDLVRVVVLL